MRPMDFDEIETDPIGPPGRLHEILLDLAQAFSVEHLRLRPAVRDGDSTGRDRSPSSGTGKNRSPALPGRTGRGLLSRMPQLNAEHRLSVLAAEDQYTGQRALVLIGIQAEIPGRYPGLGGNADYLGDHHAETGHRKLAVVHEMPFVGRPVFGTELVHRSKSDSIRNGHRSHVKRGKEHATQQIPPSSRVRFRIVRSAPSEVNRHPASRTTGRHRTATKSCAADRKRILS